ncbi:hypothetical protein [Streptomyces sp. NPDC002172]
MNIALGYTMDDLPPYEHTLAEIAGWDRFIEAHPADLLTVRTTADIHGASMLCDMSRYTARVGPLVCVRGGLGRQDENGPVVVPACFSGR